jgi:hypothetical protein
MGGGNFVNEFPMAHTGLSVVFYLLLTNVGDSAMNKFGTCREVFTIRIVGNERNERSAMLTTER